MSKKTPIPKPIDLSQLSEKQRATPVSDELLAAALEVDPEAVKAKEQAAAAARAKARAEKPSKSS